MFLSSTIGEVLNFGTQILTTDLQNTKGGDIYYSGDPLSGLYQLF